MGRLWVKIRQRHLFEITHKSELKLLYHTLNLKGTGGKHHGPILIYAGSCLLQTLTDKNYFCDR